MAENIDLGAYIRLFKRRKKYFIIPAVLIFAVSLLIAVILPPVYVSKATILVEAQQIPPEFVMSTVTGFVEQHLQSIGQRIMSRSKLVEIIKKLNLYPDVRYKMTTEEITGKMRKAIELKTIGAKGSRQRNLPSTVAFTISYKGKNAEVVQKVTNVLTSLYLEENLKIRERIASGTTSFLSKEAERLKEQILFIDKGISEFKRKHLTELPELMPLNLRIMENIEKEISNILYRIEEITSKKAYLQIQLSSLAFSSTAADNDRLTTNPYSKLKYLNLELINKKALYSEKHPDVVALKKEIKALEKEIGAQTESSDIIKQINIKKRELAELSAKFSENHPDVKAKLNEISLLKEKQKSASEMDDGEAEETALSPAHRSLKMQIEAVELEMGSLEKRKNGLTEKLKKHKNLLEGMPAIEQQYIELGNERESTKKKYAEIMNKLIESQISLELEQSQKGQRFTIIDPANYPEKPSWPNRMAIIITGFILALGGGIGIVLAVEYLDSSLRTAAELGEISEIPVMTVVPFIQTEKDRKRAKKQKKVILIIFIVSFLNILIVFHLFVMDLRIAGTKVLKRFGYYGTFR